jgi:glycosyltransferase involved in cell wall biosynthesis
MPKISAVIITYNEERYIEQCINSVIDVADEIVVVDSISSDRTPEICINLGVKFIQQKFLGYKEQKNFALQQASFDHILSLDADEALSVELRDSILRVKKNWTHDGYRCNRLNNYCGRWMYHSSLYPERKLRLFDRRKGKWGGINPHDRVIMDPEASIGALKGQLLHWLYDSYEEHIQKINHFTTISANDYFKLGIKPTLWKLLVHPAWRFFHSYFIKTGFLEGMDGFSVSKLLAMHCFLKYYKLRRLYQTTKSKTTGRVPNLNSIINQHDIKPQKEFPFKLGFDAKRAFYNHSGLGNYSRNLLNTLTKCYPGTVFTLFSPKTEKRIHLENEELIKIVEPKGFLNRFFKSLWRTKFIVRDINREAIEIYHGLSHELPFGIEKTGVKSVVTVHDLIFIRFPNFFNAADVYIYRKKLLHACRVADIIVAISHQTKRDLIDFLNIDHNKIKVIYQGCNRIFWQNYSEDAYGKVLEKHNLPKRYLLYLGTIEERKNLLTAIKAIHEKAIEIPLVVVGRKADYYHLKVMPYIRDNNVKNVRFLEGITTSELPMIYRKAECFIYPSLFEGFGIPLLEALVSGIPVITSKGGCFSEAAGPGSIYIDPQNHLELADAILDVCSNPALKQKMVEQGKEWASQFSEETIARNYFELYQTLVTRT